MTNEIELVECELCGQLVDENIALTQVYDGQMVCDNCLANDYFQCHNCGEYLTNGGAETHNGADYCNDCFNELFSDCYECGEYYPRNELSQAVDGHYYCDDCYSDNFRECDNCGCEIRRSEYNDNDGYCDDCYHANSSDWDDNCAPLWVPQLDTSEVRQDSMKVLYLGVELELEGYETSCDAVLQKLTNCGEWVHKDGSLENGIECTFQPYSLAYHHRMRWEKVLRDLGATGLYPYRTCGLHVHVSKSFFSYVDILKLSEFVHSNKHTIIKHVAKRQNDSYACFMTKEYRENNIIKYALHNKKRKPLAMCHLSRYEAINLTNYRTVEFRIFRSTLKPYYLLGCLEFCDSVSRYIKTVSYNRLLHVPFECYIDYLDAPANRCRYEHIFGMLTDSYIQSEIDKGEY